MCHLSRCSERSHGTYRWPGRCGAGAVTNSAATSRCRCAIAEIVIDRTTARCGCEYEWGVHVAFFANRVDLTPDQVASLTHGTSHDPCWDDERDRILIDIVDQLHDAADIDDALFARAATLLDHAELLDLFLLCGWYHAISFAANAARVPFEHVAPRFADVTQQ